MGWKPHKLEGCWGLNNFFTRLGVTTEFCRGAPRCTPTEAMIKGVTKITKVRGKIRKKRSVFRKICNLNSQRENEGMKG